MTGQEPVTLYTEEQVAELLEAQSRRDWLQAILMVGQGYVRITKRLHLHWAITCLVVLALGIGGGVIVERQAVVKPCVRALDAYRDEFTLLEDANTADASDQAAVGDLFARAGEIKARRNPAELRCRG